VIPLVLVLLNSAKHVATWQAEFDSRLRIGVTHDDPGKKKRSLRASDLTAVAGSLRMIPLEIAICMQDEQPLVVRGDDRRGLVVWDSCGRLCYGMNIDIS
jgi:hypothetical protein